MHGSEPLNITVLMGGPSSEREVSLMSGRAIAAGLERQGHRVTRADIHPHDASALDREGIDVVFIALHGEYGESGDVQSLCEQRELAYTGSGPMASKLALDKAATKQLAKQAGVSTPDWMIIEEFHSPRQYRPWLAELPPPVVVKPVSGGSSIDITIAKTADQRDEAREELIDDYGRVMLERFVPGRELTVGILGERSPSPLQRAWGLDAALPALEIVPAREFYDYEAKYADDAGTRYVFDHGLPGEVVEATEAAGLLAHRTLGCRDMSRVDFILDGSGVPQLLEINTIPGFTSHSLLPMAAAKVGIGFDELVDRIARMALARMARRATR